MPKKKKDHLHHLIKRHSSGSGSWFIEASIPESVRHNYNGAKRLRMSLKTKEVDLAIRKRDEILRQLEHFKDIANVTDYNPEGKPADVYSRTLETYATASPDAIEGLLQEYEAENDLHSNSAKLIIDHPRYLALRQLDRGDGIRRVEFGETIDKILGDFLAFRSDLSASSKNSYGVAVKAFGGHKIMASIKRSDVNRFFDTFVGGKDSVKAKLSSLSMLFIYALNRGIVNEDATNPFQNIDLSNRAVTKKTESMTPELLTRLLEVCPVEYRDFFTLFAYTGIRAAESRSLELVNVDDSKLIKVNVSKTESGKRLIPMHQNIQGIIVANLPSDIKVRSWLNKARKTGLLDGHSPLIGLHGIRTYWITRMLSVGVQERLVSQMAGHKRKQTITQYYDRPENDTKQMVESIKLLPDPFQAL